MRIRAVTDADLPAIVRIYQQGLDAGNASFEMQAPDEAAWKSKFLPHSRLVCVEGSEVLGWVALAAVSARSCYSGVAEVSIYVGSGHAGRGVGGRLMNAVINSSEEQGIWSLYATLFPENEASRCLHRAHGFREVGVREHIAKRDGVWRDTLILERRSWVVGID